MMGTMAKIGWHAFTRPPKNLEQQENHSRPRVGILVRERGIPPRSKHAYPRPVGVSSAQVLTAA